MRRLGHYAQMLQSHVTAYFYLVLPEMLFGIDAPPEQRNVLGLIEADPELVKRVVMLRKWGQEMLVAVFGKRMHGISSVPGGVNKSLTAADVDRFLRGADGLPSVDRVIEDAQLGLELFYDFHEKHRSDVDGFANVSSLNMSLVDADGNVDYYDGMLRIVDDDKNVVREFDYHDYLDHFSEGVEKWSYMKFPFLTELGRDAGSVRVGPLARMNVTHTLSTPLAQQALEKFHAYTGGRANNMTLHTNWARAIEIIHAAEIVRDLLLDPDLQKDELVVTPPTDAWTGEGIGVVEAPRGSLLHHYRADREILRGLAEVRPEETKPYTYGDPLHVDVVRTLKHALAREASMPLRLRSEDFEVYETLHTTTTSTVLLLDMSWSMSWEGRFAAAKRVALAMESLIRSRYPRDYFGIVGFYTRAVELKAADLPEASWNMGDPFTNLQDGLRLAADLLARHPSNNQHIIVITDGQPTAYFQRGRLHCEWPLSFGGISMRAAQETLREVERVTRRGITINTFMLDDSPSLRAFVERMTRINKGRALYTRPDRLGQYLLVDYLTKKRKRV
jgi:hypothetical protein